MPTPVPLDNDMALLVLSIPIMIVMVALAVVPLVVMSRAEHRTVAAEARRHDRLASGTRERARRRADLERRRMSRAA